MEPGDGSIGKNDNGSSLSSATITFATPPEALNRLFSMLTGSMWTSGGALLVSLLTAFGVYMAMGALKDSYDQKLDAAESRFAIELETLRADSHSGLTTCMLVRNDVTILRNDIANAGVDAKKLFTRLPDREGCPVAK